MRIYVIPAGYPTRSVPLTGIFIKKKYLDLAVFGDEIIVLDAAAVGISHWLKGECKYVSCTDDEIPLYSLHTRGFMTTKLPRLNIYLFYLNIKKLYHEAEKKYGKADVFISHFSIPAGLATMRLAQECNIEFINYEHHHIFCNEKLSNGIKKLVKNEIKVCKKFVCVSDYLKQQVIKNVNVPDDNIIVCNNSILSLFRYVPLCKNEYFNFFSAGTLKQIKRFDLLINAFMLAFSTEDKVRLFIAGEGELHSDFVRIINKNNRENQIILLGRLNTEEMFNNYCYCNCFILASDFETFGNVYREAMAVGRPVISTRNGGIQDNWNDNYGILTEKGNVSELSTAMISMVSNYEQYNREKISAECLDIYSSENTTKLFYSIIHN